MECLSGIHESLAPHKLVVVVVFTYNPSPREVGGIKIKRSRSFLVTCKATLDYIRSVKKGEEERRRKGRKNMLDVTM